MPLTTADADAVGYDPKELIVNMVAKALLSEHDEDKAQGYVAFVRDALEGWFTNDEPSKSEEVPVFETDQLNYLYDIMAHRDGLIHRFAEEIKQLVLQSCDNLLNDANAIKVLRTDLVDGAVPLSGGKKNKVTKQIQEEYEQRMLQLDETRKVLVTNMEIMEQFQKSQDLLDKQRQMRKIDRYDVEKWTKAWAEQRKKAGGPTFGPNGESRRGKGEEKSKERWEFEAKKWSQECAMFAVFNEFLLTHLAESHSAFCLMEVCVARQDNELKAMEKRMKITENVNNARHKLEMDALKKEHAKVLEAMKARLEFVEGFEYEEELPDTGKTLVEHWKNPPNAQDALQKEINRVSMDSGSLDNKHDISTSQAETFKNFDKRIEKENQELAKGDKELGERVQKIKAMALSHLNDKNDSYKMMFEKHQRKITITSHSGEMIKNEMLKIFERRLEERERKEEKRFQSSRATAKGKNPAIPSKSSKKRAARKARQQRKAEHASEADKAEENDSESEEDDPLLDKFLEEYKSRLGYHEAYSKEELDPEECESEEEEEEEENDGTETPCQILMKRKLQIAELERKLKEMSGRLEESEQAYMAKDRELSMAQTGYLRRGLGLSRGQMERNGCGVRNGVNQYM